MRKARSRAIFPLSPSRTATRMDLVSRMIASLLEES
jgi:hypothetical protein